MIDPAARSPILALFLSFLTLGSAPAFAADGDGAPAPTPAPAPLPTPTATPPAPASGVSPVPPGTAACRAPQGTRGKRGSLTIDSPSTQADDWAKWMTDQLAAGRTNFMVVPFKAVEKDEDGSDGPPDSFSQVLCAW